MTKNNTVIKQLDKDLADIRNQNQGSLKDTFCMAASGSVSPDWYWSSAEDPDGPSYVRDVRLSDGGEHWFPKDDGGRLSCRPVRPVAAPG